MSKHKRRTSNKKFGQLYYFLILHRWMGLAAALLVVILAVTGVLLNHTEALGLDSDYIENNEVLAWYGIKMPDRQLYYHIDTNWLVQIGQQLFFNEQSVEKSEADLRGVIRNGGIYILALPNALILLSDAGELIEKITPENGLPKDIKTIAINQKQQVILKTEQGNYSSNDEFLTWYRFTESIQNAVYSKPIIPTEEIKKSYQQQFLGHNISQERLLLDLHSGRLFGKWGIYLMDMAAIFMLFLAISGTWVWLKRHARKKQ